MIKYSDVYMSILAKGLLVPGEQFVGACALRHQPFWSFGIPFFAHSYLLVATSERLIALDHRKGLLFDRLDRADSYAWSDLGTFKLGGLIKKRVTVKDRANRVLLKGTVTGFFGPMANNGQSARVLHETWQQRMRLMAQAVPQALPYYAAA